MAATVVTVAGYEVATLRRRRRRRQLPRPSGRDNRGSAETEMVGARGDPVVQGGTERAMMVSAERRITAKKCLRTMQKILPFSLSRTSASCRTHPFACLSMLPSLTISCEGMILNLTWAKLHFRASPVCSKTLRRMDTVLSKTVHRLRHRH